MRACEHEWGKGYVTFNDRIEIVYKDLRQGNTMISKFCTL